MKRTINLLSLICIVLFACKGEINNNETPTPPKEVTWSFSPASLEFASQGETKNILVSANGDWQVSSNSAWCTCSPLQGFNGQTSLKVSVNANHSENERKAELTFSSGTHNAKVTVTQAPRQAENYVPAGYVLKWQDEFNDARLANGKTPMPNADKWWFETGSHGWGNNELQNYIPGFRGTDTCAVISDGTLKIMAKKVGSEVLSIRMNSKESWTYGYFEARLRMPSGKGTWPAFWMMPIDVSQGWPMCGEIDILEYVGYDPNVVHCTVHTQKYNHSIGTQVGKSIKIENAETDFHIYAVEWTPAYIKGFVDGVEYFEFKNDGKGDVNTWPFDKAFYVKLNLAWGGNWGGQQGTDPSKLPATYEIDYVRIYQKQ